MVTKFQEPQVTLIELIEEELRTKKISSRNLQAALEALHRDGLVVLKNAVDPSHLDKLNSRMVPEAKTLFANKDTHRNFGLDTGNIQQEPPVDAEYVFSDVIANPFAVAVTSCMLGPHPTLRFQSANTAFKATSRQPVHIDVDFPFPAMPWGFCININLVDTSPENGATEVWLGTHATTDVSVLDFSTPAKHVRTGLLEARRRVRPPLQPCLPKGSLVIRDFRLWHAGMPNRSDEPRVMLVSVHFPHWYRSSLTLKLPKSLEGNIEWGELDAKVEWVDEGYDYLKGAHDFTFAQDP